MTQMTDTQASDAVAAFALEQFLPYRLSVLANTVSQGLARIYQTEFGLSVPEWRVLAVLGSFPGLTASQICDRTVMDKVTVSRAVKTLLQKGLVRRRSDPADRRRRPLEVSAGKGRAVLATIIPLARAFERELLRGLAPGEISRLDKLIETLGARARDLDSR